MSYIAGTVRNIDNSVNGCVKKCSYKFPTGNGCTVFPKNCESIFNLIDWNWPIRSPAPGQVMSYARIGLNSRFLVQNINVDGKTHFRYLNGYWSHLIDASICWAAADADTQFSICNSSALKTQLLIFYFRYNDRNTPIFKQVIKFWVNWVPDRL